MSACTARGRLLLGDRLVPGAVVVRDGRVVEVRRGDDLGDLPAPLYEAAIVAPGFLDLQVNGGFGAEVGHDPDALRHLGASLPRTGVTAYLPTVISSPAAFYEGAFRAFEQARQAPGARPLGFHLEGPLLSPARHGAHNRDIVERANLALLDDFLREDAICLVTIAPERPGVLPYIPRLRRRGVAVSLGHTDATVEEFARGVDAGATMATHLYNAMSPAEHRAPGAIGATLVDDRVTAGLIVDGIHSHPAAVQLAFKAKGADGIALVSDMMAAAGMPPGAYALGDEPVIVEDGAARRPDGTLAGSILTLDEAVRNMVAWAGAAPAQALRMVTEVPARLLHREHMGRIVVGADADLVLLDDGLNVECTLIAGEVVYRRADALAAGRRSVRANRDADARDA